MSSDISDYLVRRKGAIDALIEKYLPRHMDEAKARGIFGKPRYAYDVSSMQETLSRPVWDFLDRGGKRWRPALFLLLIDALGKKSEDFLEYAVIPELMHNGTIIIDDIEDDSVLRRGKPALHRIYGTDIAINAGNMLYFLPLLPILRGDLGKEKKSRLLSLVVEEMVALHLGQAADIHWHRGESTRITEEQYLQMCALKTGTLARMAARLAAVLSDADVQKEKALGCMAETLGIAFQIQDDILDLTLRDRKKFGKSFGNDITEGKRSFPVVHVFQHGTAKDRRRLEKILDSHTTKARDIREAIALLEKYNAISYAQERARTLVSVAWKDVEGMLNKNEATETLRSFVSYLVERTF